ncbi:MAG: hypothetical protein ISR76_06190 [Planctomycetes bacterium]|nr:hypothetical protein [Planctomycetota bacterium]MBL7008569.1 hypothetical protein [Planctomycetota bacterium]
MARTLYLTLLLPAAGALALLVDPASAARLPAFRSPLASGASIAEEVRASASAGSAEALFARALELGESLEGSLTADRRRALRSQLDHLLEGIGRRPGAAGLPWGAWIEACRQAHREVAPGLMRAAALALGPDVVPLADSFNRRESPVALRVAALQALWRVDEMAGFNACGAALREAPRLDLHDRIVGEVLGACQGRFAEELLLEAASHRSPVSERAKRLAVESLGERGSVPAIGLLGQVLGSERGNVLLRKAAGEALLQIGTDEALRAIAAVPPIDEAIEPVFHAYLGQLRQRIGLPARD